MADERQRTVLEIEAETSQVRQLGDEIRQAMDTGAIKELERHAKELEDVFTDLTTQQVALVKEMSKVERGTEAYRKLKEELQDVQQQAKLTQSAIGAFSRGLAGPAGGWQEGGAEHIAFVQQTARAQAARGGAPAGASAAGGDALLGAMLGGGAGGALMSRYMGLASQGAGVAGGMFTGGPASIGALGGFLQSAGQTTFSAPGGGLAGVAMMAAGMALQALAPTAAAGEQVAFARMQAAPHLIGGQFAPGVGVPFGLGPAQALQAGAGLGQMVGGGANSQMLQAALAAQMMGVDTSATGGVMRAFRPGRGAAGTGGWQEALPGMMGDADLQLLRGSEISEYLSHMVNFVLGAGARGIQTRFGDVSGLAGRLGATGFGGLRGAQVATGLAGGALGVTQRGPTSSIDMAMLQAAGFTGGAESYAQAMKAMEANPAGTAAGAITTIMGRLRGSKTQRAMMLKRVMASMGAPVGFGEAEDLLGGLAEAPAAAKKTIEEMIKEAEAEAARAGGGVPQKRAAIEAKRAAVGEKVLPAAMSLETAQINMAKAASHASKSIIAFTGVIEKATAGLEAAIAFVRRWLPGDYF